MNILKCGIFIRLLTLDPVKYYFNCVVDILIIGWNKLYMFVIYICHQLNVTNVSNFILRWFVFSKTMDNFFKQSFLFAYNLNHFTKRPFLYSTKTRFNLFFQEMLWPASWTRLDCCWTPPNVLEDTQKTRSVTSERPWTNSPGKLKIKEIWIINSSNIYTNWILKLCHLKEKKLVKHIW